MTTTGREDGANGQSPQRRSPASAKTTSADPSASRCDQRRTSTTSKRDRAAILADAVERAARAFDDAEHDAAAHPERTEKADHGASGTTSRYEASASLAIAAAR